MAYERWDRETANVIGDYATEDDALAIVRQSVHAFGAESAAILALAFADDEGESHPIAAGDVLIQRAEA